jgi:hypothetical protein
MVVVCIVCCIEKCVNFETSERVKMTEKESVASSPEYDRDSDSDSFWYDPLPVQHDGGPKKHSRDDKVEDGIVPDENLSPLSLEKMEAEEDSGDSTSKDDSNVASKPYSYPSTNSSCNDW